MKGWMGWMMWRALGRGAEVLMVWTRWMGVDGVDVGGGADGVRVVHMATWV